MQCEEYGVIGIDVGGIRKGFHTVVLNNGYFTPYHVRTVPELVSICVLHQVETVAVDAPCAWAQSGGSRLAERSIAVAGHTIQCFKTPTRSSAQGRAFYDWVFHGEALYAGLLNAGFKLFNGEEKKGKVLFETFPHAVVCSLAGKILPANPKSITRRQILHDLGYDLKLLSNIDFVDGALCALTALRFSQDRIHAFGDTEEGYIVIPK